MSKIAVVMVDRANYGRLKPLMYLIKQNPKLDMQLVCSGSMILDRFGAPIENVKKDGFQVDSEIYIELEGSKPITMAKSLGFAVIEFASEFQRLKPDFILLIGDRFEALAAALAASYMNICIIHIQGGEVSGSIDESARHCISKLAHYHFPATKRAAEYLVRMGENPDHVYCVGCPSGDIALKEKNGIKKDFFNAFGSGCDVDASKPYLLVVFHPVTTEYGKEYEETQQLVQALDELNMPTVWLWPNIDAGSDHISRALRKKRSNKNWLRTIINFTPEQYLKVLKHAACAVGNSSSFVRDASFLGTPVVLLGNRQEGREMAENVWTIEIGVNNIYEAIKKQLAHGRYQTSTLYGDGHAAESMTEILATLKPYSQKRLNFIYEKSH